MSIAESRIFAVQLGLGLVPAEIDDVRIELGDRLDGYQPQLTAGETGLELSLTIVAQDLWVAVLQAMAAAAAVGYAAIRLDAGPAEWRRQPHPLPGPPPRSQAV